MNFIEIYDGALSSKECEIIIKYFEKSHQVRGRTSMGYKPEEKNCLQIESTKFSDGKQASCILHSVIKNYLSKYSNKYEAVDQCIGSWEPSDVYNIQKYETVEDGYKVWHCEQNKGSDRTLAWMFYLNDAKSGTEFMYYPNIRAKMGRCAIWPSGWTHVHRGAPNKSLKYIVTGWASYI